MNDHISTGELLKPITTIEGLRNTYFPVSAITFTGKFKLFFVRLFFKFFSFFAGKIVSALPKNFEEDPAYFGLKDILHLGNKYYLKPIFGADTTIEGHEQLIQEKQGQKGITINIGGDLIPYKFLTNGKASEIWNIAGENFFNSDIVVANLETPIDLSKKPSYVPEIMLNNMNFNGSEELMNVFEGGRKFDILTVANNHMLDMGTDGLLATLNFLDKRETKWVGARRNPEDKGFEILEKNGIEIGFVAYTYSMNQYLPSKVEPWLTNYLRLNKPEISLELLKNDIKASKKAGARLTIAMLHMGNAYQLFPSESCVKTVKRIFEECGPDVIVIQHPHNLQPAKRIKFKDPFSGKEKYGIVYYSLGDFVAYDIFNLSHLTGYAKLNVSFDNLGEPIIDAGFEYLYIHRSENGNLQFIPWKEALDSKQLLGNDEFLLLKEFYELHLKFSICP